MLPQVIVVANILFYIFEVPTFKIIFGIPKSSPNLMLTYASRIDLKPICMH